MKPPFDSAIAHHWFATDLNNFAWSLLEKGDRGRERVELMIHAAHAAHYHWLQVGTDLNQQRSYCLLASVYAFAERPAEATRYGEAALEWTNLAADDTMPFDRAVAHAAASRAFETAGDAERAAREWSEAEMIARAVGDEADLKVLEALYSLKPAEEHAG